ncbi:MAG: hypothetical protein KatS3mg042_1357 [Rhodothermaceae bacterium]|nr:MAG: hypothetical protein KatS3mg042_1357 [Rhodothermaceae bacterium]
MPTYVYKRADGTTFEIEQRMSDAPLTTCPTTGQPVQRLITGGAGLIFKGSGFYLTDYARKNNGSSSNGSTGGSSNGASSEASKTSESKSTD